MMFITEIYGNGMFLSGREGGAHGQLQPWPDCFLSLTPVTGTLKWNVPSSHCRASGSASQEGGREGGRLRYTCPLKNYSLVCAVPIVETYKAERG